MQLLLLFPCNNPTARAALNVPSILSASCSRPAPTPELVLSLPPALALPLTPSLSLETHREYSVSAKHHSGNFRNEQVENGGGHVHRSVNRVHRGQKLAGYKSDPTNTRLRRHKRAVLFRIAN